MGSVRNSQMGSQKERKGLRADGLQETLVHVRQGLHLVAYLLWMAASELKF